MSNIKQVQYQLAVNLVPNSDKKQNSPYSFGC